MKETGFCSETTLESKKSATLSGQLRSAYHNILCLDTDICRIVFPDDSCSLLPFTFLLVVQVNKCQSSGESEAKFVVFFFFQKIEFFLTYHEQTGRYDSVTSSGLLWAVSVTVWVVL